VSPRAAGSRVGPYEILSLIGVGGMGEVYRARDTRLGRDVAVKLLSPALAADADALARFEREARAVAALSHANIIALYDIGYDDGSPYLITELLDGVTLRDRLRDGPLPVRKAIDYARQIAAALSAAHDRGIVHRDLKPENLVATPDGRVKVLDFGVAHIAPAAAAGSALTIAPSAAPTAPGLIVGTVGYMAPEQVRGQGVDARTDIFALGAVLYEMVSGRRAFDGTTTADALSALLNADPPPLDRADGSIPVYLQRVVNRCLEKNPVERFQSARDLAFALEIDGADMRPGQGAAPANRETRPGFWRDWRVIGTASVVAAAAVAAVMIGGRAAGDERGLPRTSLLFSIPASNSWYDGVTISPDGRYLVYTSEPTATSAQRPGATRSGRFWLRRLDSLQAIPLSDTDSSYPFFFWSPDSRYLGYRGGNAIIVREMPAGDPRVVVQLSGPSYGASWGPSGEIVIAHQDGVYLASAAGGPARLLERTDPQRELSRAAPSFLPGGQRVLFTAILRGVGEQALEARVTDLEGRTLAVLGKGMVGAMYADGGLMFGAGGSLFWQPFDLDRLALTGERVRLADAVTQDSRAGHLAARTSDTGVLAYRVTSRAGDQFRIVDRSGRHVRDIGSPDTYDNFDVSPDKRQIIAARRNASGSTQYSLWLIDVVRGVTSLVSERDDVTDSNDPTWAPDGQHIAFMHGGKLVMRLANGGGERTIVNQEAYPDSFTPDGRFLTYGLARDNFFELWAIDVLAPDATPIGLATGFSHVDEGRFSPSGKWVAYHSNQSGIAEVYVAPFPPTGQRWQVSQAGGVQPRWSDRGDELYFLNLEGRVTAVRMMDSDPRRAAAPEPLFTTGIVPSDSLDQFAPLGDQFLVRTPVTGGGDTPTVQVLVNWKAGTQ